MLKVDVIVVGAGQAGCAAALDLAVAGRQVLLLDKPQHKPCAGGVTMKALNLLRFSLDELVRERPLQLDLSLNGKRRLQWALDKPMCALVERGELDTLSLKQARLAGVDYRPIDAIEKVRQTATGITLIADGDVLTADFLIAADGAHSPLRRLLIGGERAYAAYAIEALVARNKVQHYPSMTLDFTATTHGYGWLFPKGDHINVGLYASRMTGRLPNRAALQNYSRKTLGVVANDALVEVRGYPLGTRIGALHLAAGRVLFVGDAAGSCEPLLGEGIYGAILTGQLAANAIVGWPTNVADHYVQACHAWQHEVERLGQLARLFYGVPTLAYGGLHHCLKGRLTRGYAAGLTPLQALRGTATG